jgi:hypothetical protein
MPDDNDSFDDDRLYLTGINPINISLSLSLWLILAGVVILAYRLAAV